MESSTNVNGKDSLRNSYQKHVLVRVAFIICTIFIVFFVGIYSLTIGDADIGFSHALDLFIDHLMGASYDKTTQSDLWWDDYIIWNIRLPRVLVAIVAGAGLALGGATMQTIVQNPLADPYTTGISSGAVLGVAIALTTGFSLATNLGMYGLVVFAFIFSLIPAFFIIIISRITNLSPATLILTGIALSYLFNAMSTLIMVTAQADTVQAAYLWQIGTLENVTWSYLPAMFFINLIGGIVFLLLSKKFNIVTLGDDSAKSLGLDSENFRAVILLIISIMTASIVGFVGIIGFVGLVSPHIVRLLIGSDNRFVIPASAMFGAAFLLIADLISRIIIYPGQIPVGIIMSFIGAPIFLILIISSKKAIW